MAAFTGFSMTTINPRASAPWKTERRSRAAVHLPCAAKPRRHRTVLKAEQEGTGGGSDRGGSDVPEPPMPPEGFVLVKTNGDVIKLSIVATVVPFLFNEAVKATGVDSNTSGLWTTALVMVGGVFTYAYSYIARVASKDMTYAKQLRDYEDAVLQKRYEELSDEELESLAEEMDREDTQRKK